MPLFRRRTVFQLGWHFLRNSLFAQYSEKYRDGKASIFRLLTAATTQRELSAKFIDAFQTLSFLIWCYSPRRNYIKSQISRHYHRQAQHKIRRENISDLSKDLVETTVEAMSKLFGWFLALKKVKYGRYINKSTI